MSYSEDDLLPLSALQHLEFCERQCALIHIERLWSENRLTAEGRNLHDKVHTLDVEVRDDLRISRGLRLKSLALGLSGMADVVEFNRVDEVVGSEEADSYKQSPLGIKISGAKGLWQPVPVEYKRGRPKRDASDKVQLCAQALCLEEMTGVCVPNGALFYCRTRKRFDVVFDAKLRKKTGKLCLDLHELFNSGKTPNAKYSPKCDRCSLLDLCLPKSLGRGHVVRKYIQSSIRDAIKKAEQI